MKARAHRVPSPELARHAVERRAVEAVNWGMPAVNYDRMYQALLGCGGDVNQIAVMPRLQSWKNQTLTANPDLVYFMPFIDTKEVGPVVLEIPPADGGTIVGTVTDWWQSALAEIGVAGADAGRGGRYVILPPKDRGEVPEHAIALPSQTFRNQARLRSLPRSGSAADLAAAIAFGKRIRLYPLARAADPPPTVFIDVGDILFDATIRYDLSFFQALDRVVQHEPWLTRDKVMIDMLSAIGIVKGAPFAPDPGTQDVLAAAAREAHAWLDARVEESFRPFYDDKHWAMAAPPDILGMPRSVDETPDTYPVDARGLLTYRAVSSANHWQGGPFFLWSMRDRQGQLLDGSQGYRLNIPARVPVHQYWSTAVYDRATHAFIRNVARPGRGSQSPGIRMKADGSVDIFFAPRAPLGRESNWVPTNTGGQFEVCVRFYGPDRPLLDKSWTLPDIEKIS